MASTPENLKEAFAGESQANRKYLAFAKKADQDGFPNIARLFRTTAEAETIHAHGHLEAMGGIGATAANLQAAIGGETYEYTQMYPPMLTQATADKHAAKRMFGYAVRAEAVHAKLYAMALEAVKQGKDLTETKFFLCPVCGPSGPRSRAAASVWRGARWASRGRVTNGRTGTPSSENRRPLGFAQGAAFFPAPPIRRPGSEPVRLPTPG
jgi:rubrerythrin